MHTSKKLHLLHKTIVFFMFNSFFIASIAQHMPTSFSCGKIQIQAPFMSSNSSVVSPVNRMILCKSEKLYFRTSLGLFQVSSINYTSKTLTISHSTCSPSRHYVSPSVLSAGFPSPPQPNSLLLYNCLNKEHPMSQFIRNCTRLHACGVSSKIQKQEDKEPYSCLLVDDLEKLDKGFHPKDLNCSSYSRVYKSSSDDDDDYEGVKLGTRISFDIPDHVPDICNECEKPNGNCGVGLKCICHANECKDKVISMGGSLNPIGNIIFSLLFFIVVMVFFMYF